MFVPASVDASRSLVCADLHRAITYRYKLPMCTVHTVFDGVHHDLWMSGVVFDVHFGTSYLRMFYRHILA